MFNVQRDTPVLHAYPFGGDQGEAKEIIAALEKIGFSAGYHKAIPAYDHPTNSAASHGAWPARIQATNGIRDIVIEVDRWVLIDPAAATLTIESVDNFTSLYKILTRQES